MKEWLIHNAFYVRNTREENLNNLYGLPQSSDMDMWDYEFDEKGQLIKMHNKLTGRTAIFNSNFPVSKCCRQVTKRKK